MVVGGACVRDTAKRHYAHLLMWASEGVSRKKRRVICARGFCSSFASLCVLYSRSRFQRRGDPSSSSAVTVSAGGWTTTADMFLRRGRALALGLKSPKLPTAASWIESSYRGKVTGKHRRARFIFQQPENIVFWRWGGGGVVILTAAVRQLIAGWHLYTQARKPRKTMHDEELDHGTLC